MPSLLRRRPARVRCLTRLALWSCLALLAACAITPPRNPLATWRPSPNYNTRQPVLIVLHFTDEDSVQQALHTLRTHNSGGPVSAHYLIGDGGHIYQLVTDPMRAWHAGSGRWGTITDLNSASIGIELDNDGHAPFAPAQITSLLRLLTDLSARLHIPPSQVIGHQDLAPARKNDPGPLFPWAQLAAAGFGRWPQGPLCDPPAGFDPWMALGLVGYPLDDRPAAAHAFRNHFRGLQGDTLDAQDLRVLYNLAQQIDGGGDHCEAPVPGEPPQ